MSSFGPGHFDPNSPSNAVITTIVVFVLPAILIWVPRQGALFVGGIILLFPLLISLLILFVFPPIALLILFPIALWYVAAAQALKAYDQLHPIIKPATEAFELFTRFGISFANPSQEQVTTAITEIYCDPPVIDDPSIICHPNTWLSFQGKSDGQSRLFHLDAYCTGTVILSIFDTSRDDGPIFEKAKEEVSKDSALKLFLLLLQGNTTQLLHEEWK